MEDKEILPIDNIKSKIHTIRGMQVMLDSDLAELYQVETKRINESIRRNKDRFPVDFCFRLTEEELNYILRSQIATSSLNWGGRRYLPYVFTEQGVAMLSSVLNNKKAISININIIRAFISMRKILSKNLDIINKIDTIERKQIEYQIKTDEKFDKVFDLLQTNIPKQGIFYNGQIFDAYKFICDLIRSAKERIILIDNYLDETVLELFTKTDAKVTIYTKNILKLDFDKYRQQYKNIEIKRFTLAHDRFLIIDDELYHIGASLKDLGKKWFGFSKMDMEFFNILDKLENSSRTVHMSL
jgi:phage regulator Rha-like protein